nr:MAG TPA: Endoplasmic reticulum vesicle transporter [Caudoviricetes sp.]
MIMEDFYNEGVFECNTCEVVFNAYYKNKGKISRVK